MRSLGIPGALSRGRGGKCRQTTDSEPRKGSRATSEAAQAAAEAQLASTTEQLDAWAGEEFIGAAAQVGAAACD